MAAPVLSLQPVKLATGPSPVTSDQTYWKSFKTRSQIPSPSNTPITHISYPPPPLDSLNQAPDHFAVTTGVRIQLYSVRTRKLVKTISRFDDTAHGAEIRRDGRVVAAGDETGTIQIFDTNSRAILKTWKEHKQPVWVTKLSPTEPTSLLSASDDRTVRLWDLPTQESLMTFVGHQDYVRTASFLSGQASGLIVSGSYDETVRLWDPRTPSNPVMTFKHVAPVESILSLPSGTTILSAADNQISVLDLVGARPLYSIKNHQKTVTSLCLASNNTRLVSGGLDGHVKIFSTTSWSVVAGSKYSSPILSLVVIPSGPSQEDRHLAVGLQSGILSLKTRLSGAQKAKEKARARETAALLSGNDAAYEKIQSSKRKTEARQGRGFHIGRLRGKDFTGEDADIIIEGRPRHSNYKPKQWETFLRKGRYGAALDAVLNPSARDTKYPPPLPEDAATKYSSSDPVSVMTVLTALRHRSALRSALSNRDEVSLQPIMQWVCRHIMDPRYVSLCVDVGECVIELYAEDIGHSRDVDVLRKRLHQVVKHEVEKSQQAWQTEGMLGLLMAGGIDGAEMEEGDMG